MRLSLRTALGSLLLPSSLLLGCAQPPTVTQVLLSRTVILDTQSSRINLTVRDKNGLDDIVGAHLYSADGSFWFSSFVELSDGVFETSIDWASLHQDEPIQFDFPIERGLLIVLLDNEGEVDEVPITITLQCRSDQRACDGACYPDNVDCKDV